MSQRIRAALFDMDGTLLDSMKYWRYTSLEFMLRHDIDPTEEQLTGMYHTSSRRLCGGLLEEYGIEMTQREMIAEMEEYMHRHYLNDVHAKPGAGAFLEGLRAQGVRMCVATGSPRAYARDGLRRLGLLDYFEFVTDGYEFGMDKHVPAYFELMADKLDVPARELWVFEDALYSIKAAKTAGCRIAGVEDRTQQADRDEIMRLSDIYIRDYAELSGTDI